MSGFTGSAFRRLARRLGADLTWTELVSARMILAKGLTDPLTYVTQEERPLRFQLYGAEPKALFDAARLVLEKLRPEGIDLNAGCPARKVVRTGAGAALLSDLSRLFEIAKGLAEIARSYGVEASIKFRLGFERDEMERIAETLLRAGIRILALHPRLAKEGFSGKARWERVRELKKLVGKEGQVYLSGDVKSLEDFSRAAQETEANGIMIGRAALSRPWIFTEIKRGKTLELKTSDRIALLEELHAYADYVDQEQRLKMLKLLAPKFLKGVPGRRKLLPDLLAAKSVEEFFLRLRKLDETHRPPTDQSPEEDGQFPGLPHHGGGGFHLLQRD